VIPLSFMPLAGLVDLLEAAEVRAAQDPAEVNTPGAWVTLESVVPATLRGDYRLEAVVYLIVPDQDHRRALAALADLYNQVVPAVLTPDGPVVAQAVVLPDTSTPLPALRVPVHLH